MSSQQTIICGSLHDMKLAFTSKRAKHIGEYIMKCWCQPAFGVTPDVGAAARDAVAVILSVYNDAEAKDAFMSYLKMRRQRGDVIFCHLLGLVGAMLTGADIKGWFSEEDESFDEFRHRTCVPSTYRRAAVVEYENVTVELRSGGRVLESFYIQASTLGSAGIPGEMSLRGVDRLRSQQRSDAVFLAHLPSATLIDRFSSADSVALTVGLRRPVLGMAWIPGGGPLCLWVPDKEEMAGQVQDATIAKGLGLVWIPPGLNAQLSFIHKVVSMNADRIAPDAGVPLDPTSYVLVPADSHGGATGLPQMTASARTRSLGPEDIKRTTGLLLHLMKLAKETANEAFDGLSRLSSAAEKVTKESVHAYMAVLHSAIYRAMSDMLTNNWFLVGLHDAELAALAAVATPDALIPYVLLNYARLAGLE